MMMFVQPHLDRPVTTNEPQPNGRPRKPVYLLTAEADYERLMNDWNTLTDQDYACGNVSRAAFNELAEQVAVARQAKSDAYDRWMDECRERNQKREAVR